MCFFLLFILCLKVLENDEAQDLDWDTDANDEE